MIRKILYPRADLGHVLSTGSRWKPQFSNWFKSCNIEATYLIFCDKLRDITRCLSHNFKPVAAIFPVFDPV